MSQVGVGIVGAGTWASLSHIPVIQSSEFFDLRAVSTSRRSSADAAAERFGVRGYDGAQKLVDDPDVDLVVVATQVSQHDQPVRAALEAGNAVYSEWPLAADLATAEQLTELARGTGTRTVVGLQGRYAPEVRYASQLLADGYVGASSARPWWAPGWFGADRSRASARPIGSTSHRARRRSPRRCCTPSIRFIACSESSIPWPPTSSAPEPARR
jgi:predicted dehydrogenase